MAKLDLLNAIEISEKSSSKAVFGITEVADLTPVEFETQFLGAVLPRISKRNLLAKVADVPAYVGSATSVDWTATLTTPIKDQGGCGSCW
jgi:Papain family cysteine protease